MDVESIVKKHMNAWRVSTVVSPESCIRAALNELADGYEQRLSDSCYREAKMLEALEKLVPLAKRTLWLAFVWNDHNFTHPLDYALSEAKQQGFNRIDDAQEFLADLSKDMAFSFALKQRNQIRDELEVAQERIRQLSETHAIEMRAYEARVDNLEQRIREMAAERVPEAILEIGRRMIADARDNDHGTAHPMFCVEKRSIVTGIDADYTDNIAWVDEDGEILDPEEAATLEAAYDETGEVPDSYTRTGFVEEWKHVDTYLTQQAADARINGGKDGRVNVDSAYRNSEMRAVREFLMSLAAPQPKKEGE